MKVRDIVIGGIGALLGLGGGILLTRPEVHKLKKQVIVLQNELENKDKIINDANRQNRMLHVLIQENQQIKLAFKDSDFTNYGKELYNYCLLDYFTINVKYLIKQKDISKEEKAFIKAFNKFLNAKSSNGVSQKTREKILDYIEPRHKKDILKGKYADLSKIDKLVNAKDIDKALKKLKTA